MHIRILIIATALTGITSLFAEEFFVATNGCDDAEGTATRPWRTIQRAADTAQAGDTVTIRSGVYREWVKPKNAGRKDAPILYQAAKQEKVVITGADPIVGWTKRADGFWEAKVPYDSFGGMNPFIDFIFGDWFSASGRNHFRTRLIQNGKPLELHERTILFPKAKNSSPRWLVNIAGITSAGRTWAGTDSVELRGPKTDQTPKKGFETKWGDEIGWIVDGASCVFRGFNFTSESARSLAIHFSCVAFDTEIEIFDAAAPDKPLAKIRPPRTGDWRRYDTAIAVLPASADGVKDLLFRFREVPPAQSPPLAKGHAVLVPGMVMGRIVAGFESDPNIDVPELVVRPACFYPMEERRDYITVRGISFRNAGPNWAPPTSEQVGLVGVNWSRGWTIEDCEISGSSCAGITLGKYGDEFDNIGTSLTGFFTYYTTITNAINHGIEHVGHHTIRRCRITDCGQVGICGSLGAAFSTIEACDISYCHWKKPFGGAEMGGVKIHGAVDFTVKGCRIHHCGSTAGIWFDWMGQGARVTGNIMWANDRDLFFEVDHGPILVEGNDILSDNAFMACSQGAAFVGNRIRGAFRFWNDKRKTPVFRPHSVELDSLNSVACGNGAHVFMNNILTYNPRWEKETHPSRYEDNWMIPVASWKVDEQTGLCVILPSSGETPPEFKPVDAKRLGKPPFIDQEFPQPSVQRPKLY